MKDDTVTSCRRTFQQCAFRTSWRFQNYNGCGVWHISWWRYFIHVKDHSCCLQGMSSVTVAPMLVAIMLLLWPSSQAISRGQRKKELDAQNLAQLRARWILRKWISPGRWDLGALQWGCSLVLTRCISDQKAGPWPKEAQPTPSLYWFAPDWTSWALHFVKRPPHRWPTFPVSSLSHYNILWNFPLLALRWQLHH